MSSAEWKEAALRMDLAVKVNLFWCVFNLTKATSNSAVWGFIILLIAPILIQITLMVCSVRANLREAEEVYKKETELNKQKLLDKLSKTK